MAQTDVLSSPDIVQTQKLRDELITQVQECISTATNWLCAHVSADGKPDTDLNQGYRIPYALLLAGRRATASTVLSWIESKHITPAGDLQEGPMRERFCQHWSSYPLSLLAIAAWSLERYPLAEAIVRTLDDFQDPVYGGAYAQRLEVRTHRRQDLFPTAQLGIMALMLGQRPMAEGAYRWIARLFELQNELPVRLYTATLGEALLLDPGDDAFERWSTCTDFTQPQQAFFNPGIAAAFLARYSARYSSKHAAQLAKQYISLNLEGTDKQFSGRESMQIGKYGWGVAALYELTHDEIYFQECVRMAFWFIDTQADDGHWDNSPFLANIAGSNVVGSSADVTAECIQHLSAIASALGSRLEFKT